ncbi:hypothetical protein C0995_005109 [Termitomyces sp. Mi166|nr:hypothetical protein C0995_005109 [Termitomyces sp. Mi166\
MFMIARILLTMITSTLVLGAPTKAPDAAMLLENGGAAQKLNTAYQTLKATDPCIDGDKACITGGIVSCQNGTWVEGQGACSKSQACFALPSNQKAGTLVTCTTEKNALSAIEATGATGGIFGNSTATDDTTSSANITAASTAHNSDPTDEPNKDTDPDCADVPTPSSTRMSSTKLPVSTSIGAGTKDHSQTTIAPSATSRGAVTLTLTVGDEPTTLAPVTRTLSPKQASNLLAHLLENGATIIDGPSASVSSSSPASSIASFDLVFF